MASSQLDGKGKKLVLAYSGGLDTSTQLRWLADQGYEVVAFTANLGQGGGMNDEDFSGIEAKALKSGAVKAYVLDLQEDFVKNYVFPVIRSNAIYESRYLLGTSLARPCITKAQVAIAMKEGCKYVAHGSTGKGNDQVRFELSTYALAGGLECVVPWRIPEFYNKFQGRQDLLAYAKERNIPIAMDAGNKPPYSMDDNMFHISFESGVLEDPAATAPDSCHKYTTPLDKCKETPDDIQIFYEKGDPVKVVHLQTGEEATTPATILKFLNKLGGAHAIGRIDIVENRYVGIKSRGVYETPGGTIMRAAHLDIEALTMDREVLRIRDQLSLKYSELVYNGYWFSPEMEFLQYSLDWTQRVVNGEVRLRLFRGQPMILGRSSPQSLYKQDLVSMDVEGGFDVALSEGFIKTNARRLQAFRHVTKPNGWGDMPDIDAIQKASKL
jgi:argininosuccinate synthase